MGHCTALYRANHAATAALEARLQSYGYREAYAPLPPDNPLDMLLLRPARLALGRAHACRRLRARGGGEGGRRGQMAGGHRGADPIPPL